MLVDDHKLFCDCLKRLLESDPDFSVIGAATDESETSQLVLKEHPDILLLNINMPTIDSIHLVKSLRTLSPSLKFIAIAAPNDEEHLATLSSIGVNGYILRSSGMEELLSALKAVARGDAYVDPRVAAKLLRSLNRRREERDLLFELTMREKEILYWLSQGMNNKEIATQMVLSEKTIKNHVSHILKKLELSDRTQAAVLSWKLGLAQRDPLVFSQHAFKNHLRESPRKNRQGMRDKTLS